MAALFGLFRALLGIFRLVKDSRQNPSWAHTLAIPSVLLTMFRWLVGGGFEAHVWGAKVSLAALPTSDAVMMLGVWLAFLGQREYFEKKAPAPEVKP